MSQISVNQINPIVPTGTINFTGVAPPTFNGLSSKIYNVRDYGAVGNGVTDDTAAIQAALTAGAGSIVIVPGGTYITSDALIIPSNTWFMGCGVGSIIKSVTLPTGGANRGVRQLELYEATGVKITDLTFDANDISVFASALRTINIFDCSNFYIARNFFRTPGAATATRKSFNYIIENNLVHCVSVTAESHHDGVIDQWDAVHDFKILNNTIYGYTIGKYGILVTGTDTATNPTPVYNFEIVGNTVYSQITSGIWVMGRTGVASNFKIANNSIFSTVTYYPIAISDSHTFIATGNLIVDSGGFGIRLMMEVGQGVYSVNSGIISDNLIKNINTNSNASSVYSGISIEDVSYNISVTNNTVIGTNHKYAVYLASSTYDINVTGENMQAGASGYIYNTVASNKIPGGNTYTPTLTNITNVTTSTSNPCRYIRTGNMVEVTGRVEVTPTAAVDTTIDMSLPISSNFTLSSDAIGVADTSFSIPGAISANDVDDRVSLRFRTPASFIGANNIFYFKYQYIIK